MRAITFQHAALIAAPFLILLAPFIAKALNQNPVDGLLAANIAANFLLAWIVLSK